MVVQPKLSVAMCDSIPPERSLSSQQANAPDLKVPVELVCRLPDTGRFDGQQATGSPSTNGQCQVQCVPFV